MLTIPDVPRSAAETTASDGEEEESRNDFDNSYNSAERLRRSLTHPAARGPGGPPCTPSAILNKLREEREDLEFRIFASELLETARDHKASLRAELKQLEEAEANLKRLGSQWKDPPPGRAPLV
mmetsp:Transcript_5387/g.13479  ORF Transcript_5387/g.13479 Transcript_5387/m.13479 type:complete len:124 (+) Transcript_5387:111-482(+)